jgi:hypothetical protein
VALPLGDRFGFGPVQALLGCGAAGVALGYVISIFLDIFLTGSHTGEIEN